MNDWMTRRALMRNGTLLAGAAAIPLTPRRLFAQSSAQSPVRLGLASYTFRKFDAEHLMGFAKELKIPWLNLKDVHLPMTPADQVKTRADAYRAAGFTLTAAGTIYLDKDDDEDIRSKFEYCKAAGIHTMVCGPTHQTLPRVEKFVKQYDIKLAIHNHGPEDKEFPSPLDVLAAVKNMDPRIGCCVDVGHTMRTGTDVVEAIRKAGPRLYDVHMKDLAQERVKESQVAVGDGLMPVPAIFKQLIAQRYTGYVDLEYEVFPDNPMPGVTKSFAYMRGVLAGMGYKA